MPDGNLALSGNLSVFQSGGDEEVTVSGIPSLRGFSAKAILDKDGSVRVTVSAVAAYGDPVREITVTDEIDVATTDVDEALRELIRQHSARLGRKVILAGLDAWKIAIQHGEMDE